MRGGRKAKETALHPTYIASVLQHTRSIDRMQLLRLFIDSTFAGQRYLIARFMCYASI